MIRCTVYAYILNIYILILLFHSTVVSLVPRQPNDTAPSSVFTLNAPASRKVHIHTLVYLFPQRSAISFDSGKPIHGGHAAIWIDGTQTDGPLILELDFTPAPLPSKFGITAIRAKDLGVANTGKPITPPKWPDTLQYIETQGETSLMNKNMFDHQAGTGLVADAWMEDPVYRVGTGSPPNSCYEFVERTLARMSLDLDPVTKERIKNSTEYYTSYSRRVVKRVPEVASIVEALEGRFTRVNTRLFNVDFELNPKAPELVFERTQYQRPNANLRAVLSPGLDHPLSSA
ncbi:MAG: hypothetical protein Q9183_003992 [Haloplaca sp. 2 TL-2023]